MSNKITEALEQVSQKLVKNLGQDGADAVEKLYRITGEKGEKAIAKVGETDAEHEAKILDIVKKMDENAGKTGATALDRARNDAERANLRKRLADALDPKSKDAKDALKDLNRSKQDVKYEEQSLRLKGEGSGATALGQDQTGRPVSMISKSGGRSDVSGLSQAEREAKLREATSKLGDETKADASIKNKPVCSCGLLSHDQISTHTSMQAAVKGQNPNTHPALKNVLDDLQKSGPTGAGHGKCGEVATISDELWKLDPEGTKITSLDDLKAALKNSDGSNSGVFTTIIGDSSNGALSHGDYLPPCASCDRMLPIIEVDRIK